MRIRPIPLLRRADVAAIGAQGADALRAWESDWTADSGLALDCRATSEGAAAAQHAAAQWQLRDCGEGRSYWLSCVHGFERAIERRLFGVAAGSAQRHQDSRMGASVAQEATEDLIARLARAVGMPDAGAAGCGDAKALHKHFRAGSCALLLSMEVDGKALRLLLPADMVPARSLPQAQPGAPLCDVVTALREQDVPLTLQVGQVELTLGRLESLQLGDVIALPTPIEQALSVYGPRADAPICKAYLGSVDGVMAIELIKQ